jgi:hypothetical protein
MFYMLSGGSTLPEQSLPGAHLIVVGGPHESLEGRRRGWELRDTVALIAPRKTLQAFLFRWPLDGTVVNTVLTHGHGALHVGHRPLNEGRWPTNIALIHHEACVRLDHGRKHRSRGWRCAGGCPVLDLDRISSPLRAKVERPEGALPWAPTASGRPEGSLEDGVSRFFPQFASVAEAVMWLGHLIGVGPV